MHTVQTISYANNGYEQMFNGVLSEPLHKACGEIAEIDPREYFVFGSGGQAILEGDLSACRPKVVTNRSDPYFDIDIAFFAMKNDNIADKVKDKAHRVYDASGGVICLDPSIVLVDEDMVNVRGLQIPRSWLTVNYGPNSIPVLENIPNLMLNILWGKVRVKYFAPALRMIRNRETAGFTDERIDFALRCLYFRFANDPMALIKALGTFNLSLLPHSLEVSLRKALHMKYDGSYPNPEEFSNEFPLL